MSKVLISFVGWFSGWLLDNPTAFNVIRYFLAGKQHRMKKFISKYLKDYDCKSVADICCGTGDFAALCDAGVKYVGWDLNDDFISYGKNRYSNSKNIKFKKANVLKSKDFENSKFDAVFLISTIHHFSDEDLEILLPKVKKIVNKVVIIADIIPDPPHAIQRIIVKFDRGRYVRKKDEKLKILRKYFKVVKTQSIPTHSAVQFGIICTK